MHNDHPKSFFTKSRIYLQYLDVLSHLKTETKKICTTSLQQKNFGNYA